MDIQPLFDLGLSVHKTILQSADQYRIRCHEAAEIMTRTFRNEGYLADAKHGYVSYRLSLAIHCLIKDRGMDSLSDSNALGLYFLMELSRENDILSHPMIHSWCEVRENEEEKPYLVDTCCNVRFDVNGYDQSFLHMFTVQPEYTTRELKGWGTLIESAGAEHMTCGQNVPGLPFISIRLPTEKTSWLDRPLTRIKWIPLFPIPDLVVERI